MIKSTSIHVRDQDKPSLFQVYTVDLSDGYRHFIRVVRMTNSMMVKVCLLFSCLFTIQFICLLFKVNETVSINHEIPSPSGFLAQKLYLGNWPTPELLTTTTTTTSTTQRSEEVFRYGWLVEFEELFLSDLFEYSVTHQVVL